MGDAATSLPAPAASADAGLLVPHHVPVAWQGDGCPVLAALAAAIAAGGVAAGPALLLTRAGRLEDVAIEFGSGAADDLVDAIMQRLEALAGDEDEVHRFGEDRFAIVCRGGERAASLCAARIRDASSMPFRVEDRRVVVGMSIGIAATPSVPATELLRGARVALQRADVAGGGRTEIFQAELSGHRVRRLALEEELRQALERDEFELVYQPLVSLPAGQVVGLEALLRWNHPVRGITGPQDFLPVAEESGLIADIGRWALREACRQSARWSDDPTLAAAYVSVNVSGRQIVRPGFEDEVRDALLQTGLPPEKLVVELTESVLMQAAASPMATVQRLRDLGVRVALDDFGTGYSSLAYLRSFPIQMLKVDRAFVAEAPSCGVAASILRSVAQLAEALELELVAEGIETIEQAVLVAGLGYDVAQGYLFSRPVSGEAAHRLLRQGLGDDLLATLATGRAPATAPARADAGNLLSLAEACQALGVSANTLRRWADSGRIDCVRTAGGHRRFAATAVRRLNRDRTRPPVVRPVAVAMAPAPALAQLPETAVAEAMTRAATSLYDGPLGWFASPGADGRLRDWREALSTSAESGRSESLERATDGLVGDAILAGTTALERDLFLERAFEMLGRLLGMAESGPEELRLLRRLSRFMRQRALAQAEAA